MHTELRSMKLVYSLLVVGLLGGCVSASQNNLIGDPAPLTGAAQLPSIELSSLEGTELLLPRDFPSDLNLMVFGFAHEQKDMVQAWINEASGLKERYSSLSVYKVPVIDNSNAALRMIIRNGMRAGTASEELPYTLPLFVNSDRFRESVGIENQGSPAAVLFRRDGRVLWRSEGEKSATNLASLESALMQYSHTH